MEKLQKYRKIYRWLMSAVEILCVAFVIINFALEKGKVRTVLCITLMVSALLVLGIAGYFVVRIQIFEKREKKKDS